MATKIREQATAIIQLNNEKEKLVQDVDSYQQQIKKLSQELENSSFDKEKIKVKIKTYFKTHSFTSIQCT